MADQLSVNPDDLKKAGEQVADIGSQVQDMVSTLAATLASYGQPWGDDSTGDQFANGPSGYTAQVDWVMGAIGDDLTTIKAFATALSDAATSFTQQDNNG
jgi:uncharacterized protein YukE